MLARLGWLSENGRRLDAGETQREVAASWINARTGMPYDVMHVCRFAQAWRGFVGAPLQDRPPFWEAFDSQRPTTRTERVEVQAPPDDHRDGAAVGERDEQAAAS